MKSIQAFRPWGCAVVLLATAMMIAACGNGGPVSVTGATVPTATQASSPTPVPAATSTTAPGATASATPTGEATPAPRPFPTLTTTLKPAARIPGSQFRTDRIELVSTNSRDGWTVEFYRNLAYTCGKEGFYTFVIASPPGDSPAQDRPLWVRMHGGGAGAFLPTGKYSAKESSIVEEGAPGLFGQTRETGLMAKVREHPAGFRFMMPSMCDHDLYSGVGIPEENNPYSPDENGNPRSADGLLATQAAIAFTRLRVPTSRVFLHGTSAGAMGAMAIATVMGAQGKGLSGIVMDSGFTSPVIPQLAENACLFFSPTVVDLIFNTKIGPYAQPEFLGDQAIRRGRMLTPIFLIWDETDPSCDCDSPEITVRNNVGNPVTGTGCALMYRPLGNAIANFNPMGSSVAHRVCVQDRGNLAGTCNLHSPTKVDFQEVGGDQSRNGEDYNQVIIDWAAGRLEDPLPKR